MPAGKECDSAHEAQAVLGVRSLKPLLRWPARLPEDQGCRRVSPRAVRDGKTRGTYSFDIHKIHRIRKPASCPNRPPRSKGQCEPGVRTQGAHSRDRTGWEVCLPGAGLSAVARCDRRGEGWARAPLLTGTHHLVSSLQGDKWKFSLAQEARCQRARGVKAAPHAREGPDRPEEDTEAETGEEEETRGPESQARAKDASGPRGVGPASPSSAPLGLHARSSAPARA